MKWIRVEDKLPPVDESVLLCLEFGDCSRDWYPGHLTEDWDGSYVWEWCHEYWDYAYMDSTDPKVTHWKPVELPEESEKPKTEEEDDEVD